MQRGGLDIPEGHQRLSRLDISWVAKWLPQSRKTRNAKSRATGMFTSLLARFKSPAVLPLFRMESFSFATGDSL